MTGNRDHSNTQTLSQKTLPKLPKAFWALTDRVLTEWEGMDRLLEKEWKALAIRDIAQIWHIAEEKMEQAQRIKKAEKRLSDTIDKIFLHIGQAGITNTHGTDRLSILRETVHFDDLIKLEQWKTSRETLRRKVQDQNQRHVKWMEEQANLARHLIDVITKGIRKGPETYKPITVPREPTNRSDSVRSV